MNQKFLILYSLLRIINNNLYRLTRRDMESKMGRFWRYENATVSLFPVDEEQPRLGGKVRAKLLTVDWRTFTFRYKTLHGIYSDDFITFGEFDKSTI